MISLALKNIWRRRSRTIAVVLAVVLSSSLLFATMSLGNGLASAVQERVDMTNVDIVMSGDAPQSLPAAHELAGDMERKDGVESAAPMLFSAQTIRIDSQQNTQAPFAPFPVGFIPGPTRNIFDMQTVDTIEGWFSSEHDPHYANGTYTGEWTYEIGLVRPLASALGVSLGDAVTIETQNGWVQFNITLIMTPEFGGDAGGDIYFAFFRLSELQTILRLGLGQDAADVIMVVATGEYRSDSLLFDSLLYDIQRDYPLYSVETRGDIVKELEAQMAMTEAFSIAIGGVGFVIGLLFVTVSMLVAVEERRGETAMLRAVGFSSMSITKTFFLEAFILILLSTIVGFGVGLVFRSFLASYLLDQYGIRLPLQIIEAGVLARYSLLALLLGSAACLYPALRANRGSIAQDLKEASM